MNLMTPALETLQNLPKAQAAAVVPERYNIYAGVHRALRNLMSDTLLRVGRLDVSDDDEMDATLSQLELLLRFCSSHIEHENDFLHTAIEARQPAGATRTSADHLEHCASIAALGDEAAALAAAGAAERPARALRLYRHLALFVAENFQHIHVEETANAATLWAHYTDAELHVVHERLLATLAPEEHLLMARWLVPASNPAERAGMMRALQQRTPPEAFLGLLMHLRPHVDAGGWTKLARAVGVSESLGAAT